MHSFIIAGALMANTVLAGLPGLAANKLTARMACTDAQVACGDICLDKADGTHCCPSAANYCAVNEDCYDITGQQDWGCRAGGTTPNLGQHGGATCHDQMLPCGDENCFKAYLSSTCCADGTVCNSGEVCNPGGPSGCCNPSDTDCHPVAGNTTTPTMSSAAPISTTSAASSTSTLLTEYSTTSMTSSALPLYSALTSVTSSEMPLYSTTTSSEVPVATPCDKPEELTCDNWKAEDLKILHDAIKVLADLLSHKGHCHDHPSAQGY